MTKQQTVSTPATPTRRRPTRRPARHAPHRRPRGVRPRRPTAAKAAGPNGAETAATAAISQEAPCIGERRRRPASWRPLPRQSRPRTHAEETQHRRPPSAAAGRGGLQRRGRRARAGTGGGLDRPRTWPTSVKASADVPNGVARNRSAPRPAANPKAAPVSGPRLDGHGHHAHEQHIRSRPAHCQMRQHPHMDYERGRAIPRRAAPPVGPDGRGLGQRRRRSRPPAGSRQRRAMAGAVTDPAPSEGPSPFRAGPEGRKARTTNRPRDPDTRPTGRPAGKRLCRNPDVTARSAALKGRRRVEQVEPQHPGPSALCHPWRAHARPQPALRRPGYLHPAPTPPSRLHDVPRCGRPRLTRGL